MERLSKEQQHDALKKFKEQRRCAARRIDKNGNQIEWLISFEEWMRIWLDSGHWEERGVHMNQYCMARNGDIGPYSVDNVSIITGSENKRQGMIGGNSSSFKKGNKPSDYNRKIVSETSTQRHMLNRLEKYATYIEEHGAQYGYFVTNK